MAGWIYGVIVGFALSIILILILHYTVFKEKRMTALYLIMIILFSACGGIFQYTFYRSSQNEIPTPGEQIENLTGTIEDNWKNSNGGFTFEQIQTVQKDDGAPLYDDQVIKLNCYDFGSYIVFGYQNSDIYQNALFYNSKNGLILDGVMSTTAEYDFYSLIFNFNLDSFRWNRDLTKEPYYFEETSWYKCKYDNMVSLSRQSAHFVENLEGGVFVFNRGDAEKYALRQAPILTGQNATSYFIKFGDVELIGQANEGYKKINSFYNYLYQQVKGINYGTSKIIDGTSTLCLSIPFELQKNYPINQDKKAEYDGADYYGVYRCGIAVDLTWKQGNKTKNSTQNNEDYISDIEKDNSQKDNVQVDDVKANYSFSEVALKFVESKGSDLSKVDLAKSPVNVTFHCQELNETKTLQIDNFNKLNGQNLVLLNNNATWTYLIECDGLIFENYRGQFVLKSEKTSLQFSYYYLDNFIVASVGLNPVGTIDASEIDLSQNPVRIILSNDKNTYQFVFDNNSQLYTQKSMLLEMGKYNYTILSEQLIFVSVTGQLTITTTDKVMLFNYSLKVDQPLAFDIKIENYSSVGKIHLNSDEKNVVLIQNTLPSNKTYIVGCFVYDDDGHLIESFSHTHSTTIGACSDTWTPQYMKNGVKYTIQLRFTSQEDSLKTYLSDVTTFVYDSSKGYQVTYDVKKNS